MKILVTIKAILNYLYNNLINLIWVKKIRFEDGTEMDSVPVGNNLYDIILLSQAIANKGWASMSKTTRQDLPKADVPTVYNDILTKYRNCDNAPSSSYVQLLNDCSYYCFSFDDTYIYGTTNPNQNPYLKRSPISIFPSISWEQTPISMYINSPTTNNRRLAIGDNLIVTHNERDYQNGREIIHIYKKSDFSLHKSIEIKLGKNSWIYLLNIDGVKTFYIFYPNIDDNNYTLVTLVDSETAEFDTIRTDLTGGVGLPAYDNGTFTFYYDGDKYISKSNDNFRTITQISKFDYSYSHETLRDTFKIGNNLVCCCGNGRLSGTRYSTDNGETWQYYNWLPFSEITNGAWCDGETFYGCCFDDGYYTHLYKSTDLIHFTKLISSERTGSGTLPISILDNPNTIFIQDGYDVKYLGIIKTVYTDTYTVNGVNVNINYYKYDDWKICLPDGTNDTNLDTVYNFLGYLNYWRLDEPNETVSIPRDKNLWTFMFVGDNYREVTLPTGIYSAVALKSDLSSVGLPTISYFEHNSGSTLDTNLLLGNAVMIFKNGLLLQVGQDYTLSGSIITFTTPLVSSDKIAVINGVTSAIDLTNYKQKAEEIIINDTAITISNILANKNYVFNSNAITSITLTACETSYEETTIEFSTGATAPTLTDNTGIVWVDGSAPTLNANKSYLIVIFNNLGFVKEY